MKSTPIKMDGAVCVQTEDGSILIKHRKFFTWLAITSLGLFLLGILWGTWIGFFPARMDYRTILVCLMFIIWIISLARSLRNPSIHVNAPAKVVEIGDGSSAQQILFSTISFIALDPSGRAKRLYHVRILATLTDKTIILFGSVSGSKTESVARAMEVAQLLAKTLGVQVFREPM